MALAVPLKTHFSKKKKISESAKEMKEYLSLSAISSPEVIKPVMQACSGTRTNGLMSLEGIIVGALTNYYLPKGA